MLNKLFVTKVVDEGWYLSFDGLISTNESIKIDESTATELLKLQQVVESK